jgi:hypothetical protein
VSPVPTAAIPPTSPPTELSTTARPTASPIDTEAHSFTELEAAITQAASCGAKLNVRLLADIMITATPHIAIASQVMIYSHEGAILRGGGSTQLFYVEERGRLSGANITLRGGYSSSTGGAVFNCCTLNLANCVLADNSATNGGGGVSSAGEASAVNLNGCVLANNDASRGGGGGYRRGMSGYGSATVRLNDCTLRDNSAMAGGAVGCRNYWHWYHSLVEWLRADGQLRF